MMRKKPKLSNIHTVAQSRIFNLESMDVEFSNGETRVYERLMSRGNGAVLVIPMLDDETVLMITHRLSSLQAADRIVVMHSGALDSFGSHDELMALKGRYFALYQSQFAG